MKKLRYMKSIPQMGWRCPSCDFLHDASQLLRIDGEHARCKDCAKFVVKDAYEEPTSANE
jgi:hypothetical protein